MIYIQSIRAYFLFFFFSLLCGIFRSCNDCQVNELKEAVLRVRLNPNSRVLHIFLSVFVDDWKFSSYCVDEAILSGVDSCIDYRVVIVVVDHAAKICLFCRTSVPNSERVVISLFSFQIVNFHTSRGTKVVFFFTVFFFSISHAMSILR